jgi:hypothetical protein
MCVTGTTTAASANSITITTSNSTRVIPLFATADLLGYCPLEAIRQSQHRFCSLSGPRRSPVQVGLK